MRASLAKTYHLRVVLLATALLVVLLVAFSSLIAATNTDGARATQSETSPPRWPRSVVVGIPRRTPPHYDVDRRGEPRGFAIDLIESVLGRAGMHPSYRIYDRWDDVVNALALGEVDLIPTVEITPELDALFDFTLPVETFAIKVFVRASDADIDSLEGLRGKAVAVVGSNAGQQIAQGIPNVRLVPYELIEHAIFALLSSQVDALVCPQAWASKLVRDVGVEQQFKVLDASLAEVKRAIAVRAGNETLLAQLAPAVAAYVTSDEYPRDYHNWLGTAEPYWTIRKALWVLGAVMGLLLIVVSAWLVIWRYRSVVVLNDRLRVMVKETERTESALRANEDNFRSLIQNATDGVLVIEHGAVSFANAALARLLDYSVPELVGMPLTKLAKPAVVEMLAKRFDAGKADTDGTAFGQLETAFIARGGAPIEVEISAAITGWQGQQANLVIVRDIRQRKRGEAELNRYRDKLEELVVERTNQLEQRNRELQGMVTERQQTLDQLAHNEALLATAQRLAHVGAWEWTAGESRVTLTEEARRIYGVALDRGDLYFDSFVDCVHPDDRLRFTGELYRALSNHAGFDLEYRVRLPDGEVRFIHGIGRVVHDPASNSDRVLGAVCDITQRNKMDQMKREFVSVVSHELRTPLTAIRGALGLLGPVAGADISGEAKQLVDIAQRNSQRLTHLVNDILDIEKLEAGKLHLSIAPVSVLAALREAIEANQAYAQLYKVKYSLAPTAVDAIVDADARRLQQVLANLLSNAAKFSAPSSCVNIDASRNGAMIRISVTDSGCGISPEFRARVFQKFAQEDASDVRAKGGTGLGLAITKSLIEQMGGFIDFSSEAGNGSTFFFELPVHVAVTYEDPKTLAG